jgi:hypothetical protein
MSRAIAQPRSPLLILVLTLAGACMPPQEPETNGPVNTGGRSGSGGGGGSARGSGGNGSGGNGSGGMGSGGSGTGGAPSGTGGSGTGGGSGGSAAVGTGGSGSGGAKGTGGAGGGGATDAAMPPSDGPSTAGTWSNLNLAMSGCVFCHPGEVSTVVNSDFGVPDKLHEILLGMTKYVTAACQFKTLVVPGKPMESLVYLKLLDKPPAGCGERMPKGKPIDPWVNEVIKNWIMAGAPSK